LAVSGNISLQNAFGPSDLTLTATAFDIAIHGATIDAGTVTTNGHTFVDGTVAFNAPLTVNGALDITTINPVSAQSVSAGDIYNASVGFVVTGNVISSGSIDNIGHISAGGNISAAGSIGNGFGNLSASGNISAGTSITNDNGTITATGNVSAGPAVPDGTGSISNGSGSIDAGGNIIAGDTIGSAGALSAGANLTAGGKLTNSGTITLTGGIVTADSIEWTGGTITASSVVIANGGSIANGVGLESSLNLNGGTINFAAANVGGGGTVVLGAAASMRVTGSTSLNNSGGFVNNGTIAIDADGADANLTVNGDFTNNTTLTLTSSNSGGNANLTVSGGNFFNSGIIDVQAGAGGTRTIQAGGFEQQGTGRIQGNSVLDIGAPFSWTGGAGVIASGVEVRLNQGGTMFNSQGVIDGVLRNANGTLQIVNATLSGTGRLANDATLEFGGTGSIVDVPVEGAGNLNVLGGATFNGLVQQGGTVHVASGVSGVFNAGFDVGTLDLAGAADVGAPSFAGTLIVNGGLVNGGVLAVGTLDWTNGAIDSTVTVNAGGTIAGAVNLTGSLTLAGGILAITDATVNGGGTIHNNADIATNGGSNALFVPLDGNGAVTVNALTNFAAPVSGALTFYVGGQATFATALQAAAAFVTSGGVTASSTVDIGTLGLQGGSFSAAGALTVQDNLNWTGGVLSAPQVTLANGGVLSGTGLTLGGPLNVTGGLLVNAPGSSLTVTDVVALSGGAAVFNQGTLTLNSGAAQPVQGTAAERFINAGTLVKGGAGAAEVATSFSNSGTVNLTGGTLTLRDGSGTDGGSFNAAPGTTLKFAGSRLLDPTSTVNAVGATVEFDPLAGKTVFLQGAFNAGTVNVKSGTVAAATTTSFITAGDYTQTGGVLQGAGGNVRTTNSFNFPGGTVSGTFGSIDVTHMVGSLPIGSLNALGSVTLNAVNGALVDANGAGVINLNAPSVTLSAASGINLDTQTGTLSASNLAGALNLRNTGIATFDGISQGGGAPVILRNAGTLTLSNVQVGASNINVNVTGGSLLQGTGGPAITTTGPVFVRADTIGAPGARLMVDSGFTLTTLSSAGSIHAGAVGDAAVSSANLQVGAGGSLDFLTSGKLDVVGDFNLGGAVTLQAQGGTLTIGTASGAALITGQNVSLSGSGVAVTNGSTVAGAVSGVQASGSLTINTGGGSLDVTGGGVQDAVSKLVSAGNAHITVGGVLRITGGTEMGAAAYIDPTSAGQTLAVSAAGGVVLQGGSKDNAFAALAANGNVDFAGTPSLDLRAGSGTLANAAIAAYGGQWVNLPAICVGCTPVLPTNPLVFGGGGITGVLASGAYSGFIPAPPVPVAPPPAAPPELFTNQPKPEPVVGEPPKPKERGEVVVDDDGC
jgi:hypothetical protein